jgi:integrase
MGASEVEQFLTHLAVEGRVSASTQNQALSAVLFLYRQVLEVDLPWLNGVVRAHTPTRMPVVLPRREVQALLDHLDGHLHLVGQLLYGSGLRLMEALRLRVKDVDFDYSQIVVRNGKGQKDRVTILPDVVVPPLRQHLAVVRDQHERAASWLRRRRATGGTRAQISAGRYHLGMAVRVSRGARERGPAHGRMAAASFARAQHPARDAPRSKACWNPETGGRTRCATASPRICSSEATTSARCRSSWGTRTCARRRSTRT